MTVETAAYFHKIWSVGLGKYLYSVNMVINVNMAMTHTKMINMERIMVLNMKVTRMNMNIFVEELSFPEQKL